MIFIRRRNKSIPGSSPSVRKYNELLEKYGFRVETTFGRKIFPSGEQFVKDAKTGQVYEFTSEIKYLGRGSNNSHYYLHEDHTLKAGDIPVESFEK